MTIDYTDGGGYSQQQWNQYAPAHLRITASVQWEVYRASAGLLFGDVIDLGCGSGKLAPYLARQINVQSYLGVDSAESMVHAAQWLLNNLQRKRFEVRCSDIEALKCGKFNSAASINSFYAWPQPLVTLKHIATLLNPGAVFVLATPNERLNMKLLLQEAQPELLAHPDFGEFKRQNLAFAANAKAHFVRMDEIIGLVRSAGFRVIDCHQRFFLGGLNFLVLENGEQNNG